MQDPQIAIMVKFVIAIILGGVIGWEREVSDKPAGLRTHMIVVGAACLLVSLNDLMIGGYVSPLEGETVRSDPLRVVHAIIVGISFLGAGTIIRRGPTDKVEGLTTAASILLASVIGIYVGLSQYTVAVGVTLIAVFVLHWLDRIVLRIYPKK